MGELSPDFGLFKTFFNDCSAPCFVKDDQGCYLFINDEFERQFGVKRSTFLGTTASSWVSEASAKIIRQRDLEILSEHSTSSERDALQMQMESKDIGLFIDFQSLTHAGAVL